MEKLYSSKTCLKTAGGEMHSPHPLPLNPPLPAPKAMSITTTPTSRFGISMMWGKFCHSCFEITARTALAQFGHFTLKTRVRFQKGGGGDPPNPLPGWAAESNPSLELQRRTLLPLNHLRCCKNIFQKRAAIHKSLNHKSLQPVSPLSTLQVVQSISYSNKLPSDSI